LEFIKRATMEYNAIYRRVRQLHCFCVEICS